MLDAYLFEFFELGANVMESVINVLNKYCDVIELTTHTLKLGFDVLELSTYVVG